MRSDFNQIVCIENDICTGICKYLNLMINYLYTYLSLYVMCILFYYWMQVDERGRKCFVKFEDDSEYWILFKDLQKGKICFIGNLGWS